MLILAIVSLSGGQGKTTCALFLGKRLAKEGWPTLVVDADPQHNLTTYLEAKVDQQPTLLEFLKKAVELSEAIYPVDAKDNLYIIPSDDALDAANEYLASSGAAAILLKRRLEVLKDTFKVCIIDAPPQRSQICLSIVGAADYLLIPAEATVKGYGSLVRSIDLWKSMRDELKVSEAELLGVLPFRDRWIGLTQSKESQLSVTAMGEEVGQKFILPSIRESERYKQAINQGKLLSEMGFGDLEYPFDVLVDLIKALIN
ncbi:ParA family protein [Gloeothece verrucosa]|uniref:Cobyrinic acid ac-diamide synthase n=1 Tax=Gloeothece verrucosa (strain PCC 7822) TaxID=497965 RepID=E0UNB9_GLOV7|nr:ParA family protein [Gloeothece verrucosa]ADN18449.1 Cobyrinic acid ac-diamide synthase [Gloeothece verrucosa PCC 7822]